MTETPPQGTHPGEVGGPGILEVDQEKASIVLRRVLRHPIEDVWSAVTDPKKVEVWFMVKVTREELPGGRLTMEHPNGVHATGRVLKWRPPRTYEYEWNLPPGPNQPKGETSTVRWELSPAEGGTLLVMTHRKLTRPTAEIFVRGVSVFLDRLSAQMDGTPLPEPPWLAQVRSSDGPVRKP
ncbi:MAG: SRPBCC domain-containing protein [Thermoplasmata archaeon]|nr:SRPBCC domain-containing protein [Thermoplasmata archaeon]